jgi:hypothetical protein
MDRAWGKPAFAGSPLGIELEISEPSPRLLLGQACRGKEES